jgi:nucleoside-diphosphate-sugar epimerase
MKVAVTGSTGFIGSHLLPLLSSRGYLCVALTEPSSQSGGDEAQRFLVDVTSGEGLAEGLKGSDGVVHLAGRNHVLKETEKDPLSAYRRVNVEGTRNVIRAAVQAGARWFIHFSSVKAMGEGGEAVLDEDSPCKPSIPYGISKLESEEVVRRVAEESGIRALIFRLPMVYGPGNKGNLPRMIRWADRGLPFPLVQPVNLRSMVYVGNVVAAVKAVLESHPAGSAASRTYIVKDEVDYSTRMIYSSICRELGKIPRFLPLPAVLGRIAGAISEDFRKVTSSFRVSSAKIREEIGFVPPVSGEEGIARTVQWYKRSVL